MKEKEPTSNHSARAHQRVTETIKIQMGKKAIRIGMTDQKLSGHAGQVTFWAFLALRRFRPFLAAVLPHRLTSPNAGKPVERALSFIAGVVAGAGNLTRVAQLRGDPLLAEVLQVKGLPSQSSLSRFFARFSSAGQNLRAFRPLWRWVLQRLPSVKGGYTLDLDSTALVHEDGHQEGVRVGHSRLGLKPCLHPLLAVLAEAKVCVQFWLRPGNTHCSSNVVGFTLDLLHNLPSHIRLRLVRGDSGFHYDPWLSLLETQGIAYIVVADLSRRLQSLIRGNTRWESTGVEGVETADLIYESRYAARPRRLILIRRKQSDERGGGKLLFECPGYKYQALLTSLSPAKASALEVWRDYNGRAGVEGVIKELRNGFGVRTLCCQKFFATEAALSFAITAYNLCVLFQRFLGWLERVNIATLRYRLFHCAGIISRAQGTLTLKLGISPPHRAWWQRIWEKILSPFPNCNAVGQHP